MILIEVASKETTVREIPAKGDRGAFTLYEQEAYAHLGRRYPERIVITHRNATDAHEPGKYSVDAESFYVGRFNKLEFNLRVKPASKAQAA